MEYKNGLRKDLYAKTSKTAFSIEICILSHMHHAALCYVYNCPYGLCDNYKQTPILILYSGGKDFSVRE